MRHFFIALITMYRRLLSPFIGRHCRFHPSCSAYAIESIGTYGVCYGARLTVRRLTRCHPWHPGGYDPVPLTKNSTTR